MKHTERDTKLPLLAGCITTSVDSLETAIEIASDLHESAMVLQLQQVLKAAQAAQRSVKDKMNAEGRYCAR
jgi:hypothetical protein